MKIDYPKPAKAGINHKTLFLMTNYEQWEFKFTLKLNQSYSRCIEYRNNCYSYAQQKLIAASINEDKAIAWITSKERTVPVFCFSCVPAIRKQRIV